MPEVLLKDLCEDSYHRLLKVCMEIERFLNANTLENLIAKSGDAEEYQQYYRNFLSDLRHLLVNCENASEKLAICLRRPKFNNEFAEETLYYVYQACVNQFFYPKEEVYEEDGRHSYTGKDAINFFKPVTAELKQLVLSISKVFEYLREELHYYETDYATMKKMKPAK